MVVSYISTEFYPLYFCVIGGGVVDQLTVLGEARAVAGAVPSMLGAVVFEGATEMRTSGRGGGKKSYRRVKGVYGKLRAQKGTGGIEQFGARVAFFTHKIAEKVCGDHGVCHAPFIKARRHENVGCGP